MGHVELERRLGGIRQQLLSGHRGGAGMASASKGAEREALIDCFLANSLPAAFRFGTGMITDAFQLKSGQVDVVVEFPWCASFPLVGSNPRLYLAEGVVAAIEVKSDLTAQWDEVVSSARSVNKLWRQLWFAGRPLDKPRELCRIPFYAVGYCGWKQMSTVMEKLLATPEVRGVLVLESGMFVDDVHYYRGDMSLWGLVTALHDEIEWMRRAQTTLLPYSFFGPTPPSPAELERHGNTPRAWEPGWRAGTIES